MIKKAEIIAVGANPDKYHEQTEARGSVGFVMGAGQLRAFAACPRRWVTPFEQDGEMRYWEPPETPAKLLGAIVDCLVLTPGDFRERFFVLPKDCPRRPSARQIGAAKKSESTEESIRFWLHVEEQRAAGKTIVTEDDLALAKNIAQAVGSSATFLAACKKQVWLKGEYHAENGMVIPTKALVDAMPGEGAAEEPEFVERPWMLRTLFDLKTCRSADVRSWARFAFSVGYHVQAAWYYDHAVAAGLDVENFGFLLVETEPPHVVGRRIMTNDENGAITFGRYVYKRAMELYARCLETATWPDYDTNDVSFDGWTPVVPEPWMVNAEMFAPKIEAPAPEPPIPDDAEGITP